MPTAEVLHKHAALAALSRDDPSTSFLILQWREGWLTSHYGGAYAAGTRATPWGDDTTGAGTLNPQQFAVVARQIPPDAEVRITLSRVGLTLAGGGIEATLRSAGESEIPQNGSVSERGVRASVDVGVVAAEASLMSAFVAKSVAYRALAGLRLAVGPGRIALMAADGVAGIAMTSVSADTDGSAAATVSPGDFVTALRLAPAGSVELEALERALTVRAESDVDKLSVRLSTLAGGWPSMKRLSQIVAAHRTTMQTAALSACIDLATALQTGGNIVLEPGEPHARLAARGPDAGEFHAELPGTAIPWPLIMSASHLGLAARLGDTVDLLIPEAKNEPLTFVSGSRRYWVMRMYDPAA